MRGVAEKEFYGEAADFYVSAAYGVKEGGVRRGAKGTRDVGSEGCVFEVWDGRDGGVDGKGRIGGERVWKMCGISGGWWGGGGGMWSCHTFSLTRLEPTRTGVGSPGAKMESVVEVRRQEPEV